MSTQQKSVERFGGRRAVVIGGSMAGLVSARVLSDHFDEVVVVERDPIADDLTTPRKGVPQGRQPHALLARGEQILSELFPGLVSRLQADGAVIVNFDDEVAWYHFGGWKVPNHAGIKMVCMSRPLLESHVRRSLFALPNVQRMDRHEVTELLASPDRARITGVRIRPRDSEEGILELNADLVVEATGRGSKTGTWLEQLGYSRPEESVAKVRTGYASRIYRRIDPWPYSWQTLYLLAAAPQKRIGAFLPMEGNRLIVWTAGMLGDYPPDDPEGFMTFVKSLPDDTLYRVLSKSEPLSDIQTYKFPANTRRHYERLSRIPEGLAVIGDAYTSFNPIFGQGITVACVEAMALRDSLSEQRRQKGAGIMEGFARRYHQAVAKATELPWLLATSEDFRYPEVEGKRPPLYPLMKWYTGLVHRATQADPVVYGRFLRAMHLLGGLEELLDPRIVMRVLRAHASPDPKRGTYPFADVPAPAE